MKKQGFMLGRFLLVLVAVAATMFGGIALARDGYDPGEVAVETNYGKVMGYQGQENTLVWLGIPFAQPPVGELRWRAPKDPEPWRGVLNTQQFSNACPQFSASGTLVGNEDCLYLNIWRPQNAGQPRSGRDRLPVYFWIHGGGDSTGAASLPYFDGTMIASKSNLVVVSIQYRLGPLGWFANPALRTHEDPFNASGNHGTLPALRTHEDENRFDASGNYGTLDIIKALKWVRENIEAFGGDPDNVTIAGESSGAADVLSLLISPAAQGLFHKAISESSVLNFPVFTGFPPHSLVTVPLSVGDSYSAQVLTNLGYTGGDIANYLRSLSVSELYKALPLGNYPPASNFGMLDFPYIFTDGAVINTNGVNALDDPREYNQVPLMIGSNLEEFKLFIFSLYGTPGFTGDNYQGIAEYESEIWKQADVDSIANKMSAHHSQPGVYAYQLLYGKPVKSDTTGLLYYPQFPNNYYTPYPNYLPFGGLDYALVLGAWHTMDLPFFFDTFSAYDEFFFLSPPGSPFLFRTDNLGGYTALSNAMMGYAAQFARTGNPNGWGPVRPSWHAWQENGKRILLDADQNNAVIQMEQ
jgi:para-nitrobenzyl esterase